MFRCRKDFFINTATKEIMHNKYVKNKLSLFLFLLSASMGTVFVADKLNINAIIGEQKIIEDMTNKTLNISFVPNNSYMKNNVNLFNAITQTDINNISKINGVKSVKPIDTKYNPLSGYLKVDSKSSYVELYGINEDGEDANKNNIEIVYGRAINSNDRGKNVIVLNMDTVDDMQIADAKSLIGSGVEVNNTMYEVVGIMNVVIADERDNTTDLMYASLIPKSTSKEIVARASANSSSYSSITVSVEENANANAVEASIYNLLYQQHENINGYYEKDVEYNLPKKLGPTITVLNNFVQFIKLSIYFTCILSFVSLIKTFIKTKYLFDLENELNDEVILEDEIIDNVECLSEIESEIDIKEGIEIEKTLGLEDNDDVADIDGEDNGDVADINDENDNLFEKKSVKKDNIFISTVKKIMFFIQSNTLNILVILFALVVSTLLSQYYLCGKSTNNIFNISIYAKLCSILISIYLIKITSKTK